MVQVIERPNLGSKIGSALGKSIQETGGRVLDAYQVGQTLDSLRDAYSGSGKLDVLDVLSRVTQTGMLLDPQQAAAFQKSVPAIISEMQRQRYLDGLDGDTDVSTRSADTVRQLSPTEDITLTETVSERPAAEAKANRLQFSERDLQQLNQLGDQGRSIATLQSPEALQATLAQDFTFSAPEFQERIRGRMARFAEDEPTARAKVEQDEQRLNAVKNSLTRQRLNQVQLENEYRSAYTNELERAGIDMRNLPAEAQRAFDQEGLARLAQRPGFSPQQAAQEIVNEAEQFVKQRDELIATQDAGAPFAISGILASGFPSIKKIDESFKGLSDRAGTYRRLGMENLLFDDFRSKGMSEEYASLYAYGMNDNLLSGLNNLPDIKQNLADLQPRAFERLHNQAVDKVAAALNSDFGDADSLLAVKAMLNDKGYDAAMIMPEAVDQAFGDDDSRLNNRIKSRELPLLSEPMRQSLASILFTTKYSPKSMFSRMRRAMTSGRKN